jgi:hypothetical protein
MRNLAREQCIACQAAARFCIAGAQGQAIDGGFVSTVAPAKPQQAIVLISTDTVQHQEAAKTLTGHIFCAWVWAMRKTATRLCMTTPQVSSIHNFFAAAIATAKPKQFPFSIATNTMHHHQLAESLSGNVFRIWVGRRILRHVTSSFQAIDQAQGRLRSVAWALSFVDFQYSTD